MDTATATALLEITETSRAAFRHQEPGAEAPVEARYADILEALMGSQVNAPLQVADRPRANASCLCKILLGQPGTGTQLPQ